MRKNRTVTLSAVAAASEVSVSAASLAIRGEDGVSEATRARVLAAAEKLGYRPAVRSRVLRPSTRPVLAVLLNDLSSPYNHDVVSGIEAAAEAAGSSTTLAHGGKDVQRLEQRFFSLASSNPDGMVVISSRLPIDSWKRSPPGSVTVVGRLPTRSPGSTPSPTTTPGAAAATEHLLSLGHRRIAFLRSSTRPAAMHRQRGSPGSCTPRGLRPGDRGPDRRRVGHPAHRRAPATVPGSGRDHRRGGTTTGWHCDWSVPPWMPDVTAGGPQRHRLQQLGAVHADASHPDQYRPTDYDGWPCLRDGALPFHWTPG